MATTIKRMAASGMPEDQRIEIDEDDDTIGAAWDIGVSYDLIGSDDDDEEGEEE